MRPQCAHGEKCHDAIHLATALSLGHDLSLVALRVIRHEKKIAFQEIKTHPQRSRGPATASAEIIEAQPQRGVAADHDAALSARARVS